MDQFWVIFVLLDLMGYWVIWINKCDVELYILKNEVKKTVAISLKIISGMSWSQGLFIE